MKNSTRPLQRKVGSDHRIRMHVVFFTLISLVMLVNGVSIILFHATDKFEMQHARGSGPRRDSGKSQRREDSSLPIFSICLLTRDDLGILPEWVAYHYHAANLRHLVVAVDPASETHPRELLQEIQGWLPNRSDTPGSNGSVKNSNTRGSSSPLRIDFWEDSDFMPTFFLNQSYGEVPNFLGVELHDKETYAEWVQEHKVGYTKRREMVKVNNHRYRQTRFIAQCCAHLASIYPKQVPSQRHPNRQSPRVLVSTLDTDEYLVVNPWILRNHSNAPVSKSSEGPSNTHPDWTTLEAGSVLQLLVDYQSTTSELSSATSSCIQVPRLLFGSVETNRTDDRVTSLAWDSSITASPNSKDSSKAKLADIPRWQAKMETLRWKYHAAWNDPRNFQQKVILDLHKFPKDDELWSDHVNSVHRPSRALCPPETDQGDFQGSAVAAYHYLGSLERYFARPQDLRRNRKRYRDRSNLTFARETGWIDQWLPQFTAAVGNDVATKILRSYVTDLLTTS